MPQSRLNTSTWDYYNQVSFKNDVQWMHSGYGELDGQTQVREGGASWLCPLTQVAVGYKVSRWLMCMIAGLVFRLSTFSQIYRVKATSCCIPFGGPIFLRFFLLRGKGSKNGMLRQIGPGTWRRCLNLKSRSRPRHVKGQWRPKPSSLCRCQDALLLRSPSSEREEASKPHEAPRRKRSRQG